jgi:hypothetical protein
MILFRPGLTLRWSTRIEQEEEVVVVVSGGERWGPSGERGFHVLLVVVPAL